MTIPKDRKELRNMLLNKVTMMRPRKHDDSAQWMSPDRDVLAMTNAAMNSTAAAFDQKFWPDLMAFLEKASGGPVKFEEEVTTAFKVIKDFIERSTDKNANDMTFYDTLDAVGWSNMPETGRIAYLAMFSTFFIARYWVACRQLLELGMPPERLMDRMTMEAGELFRVFDQNVDPAVEAVHRLQKAATFAVHAGMTDRTIEASISAATVEARKNA